MSNLNQYRVNTPIESDTSDSSINDALQYESSLPFGYQDVNWYRDQNQQTSSSSNSSDSEYYIMATPTIYDEDGPLQELPTFPYRTEVKTTALASAKISPRYALINDLQGKYDSHDNKRCYIQQMESFPFDKRSDAQHLLIKTARAALADIENKVKETVKAIETIDARKAAFKPTLDVPKDHEEGYINNTPIPLDANMMSHFMNQLSDSDRTSIDTIWRKLKIFVENRKLSHEAFKEALLASTSGEQLRFIQDNHSLPLSELAVQLANRYITETPFSKAVRDLKNFTRPVGQRIRQTVAELKVKIDQASVIYAEDQRKQVQDFTLRTKLRELVSEKTRNLINRREDQAHRDGSVFTIDQLIDLIDQEEHIQGSPAYAITASVSINNTESVTAETQPVPSDPRIDQIASQLNNLTQLVSHVVSSTQPQLNAALRNVTFDPKSASSSSASASASSASRPATPYNFSDPANKLPAPPSTAPPPQRSSRDRSQDRARYPSYERWMDSTRRSTRDRSRDSAKQSHSDRRFQEQMAARSRSASPTSYYRAKSHAMEDILKEQMKKADSLKVTQPPPAPTPAPAVQLPAYSQPPPSYGQQAPGYGQRVPGQVPMPLPLQPPITDQQRQQAYSARLSDYKARKSALRTGQQQKRPSSRESTRGSARDSSRSNEANRSKSRDRNTSRGREGSRSRERMSSRGRTQYNLPFVHQPPIIHAHPQSHVTIQGCPICFDPIDHPIEACFIAQNHVREIDLAEN